jgi:DNA mismatch repair protein MutS
MSLVTKCKKQEKSIYQEYYDIRDSSILKYGEKTILFMQIGDFFEIYGESREKLSICCDIMDLIITKKNREKESSHSNPFMSGFQIRSRHKYINKCIKNNYTVVLVEQTSPPPKPSREITQVISSNALYIDQEQSEINNNYLMVIYIEINSVLNTKKNNYSCSLVSIEVLSNELIFYELHSDDINEVLNEITRFYMFYDPKEIIFYEINNSKTQTTKISNSINLKHNQCVKKYYNIDPNFEKPKYQNLVFNKVYKNDGLLSPIENLNLEKYHYSRICLVITFEYIFQRNPNLLYSIKTPEYYGNSQYMTLYNNAQIQLNIIDNNTPDTNNSSYNSLNDVVNHCITPMGKRYLKNRLCNPYTNYDTIQNYYDLTEKMIENGKTDSIRLLLKSVYDLQKLFRKLIIKYITPGELYKVYLSLKHCLDIVVLLNETNMKSDVEKLFNNKNVEMLKESVSYLEDTFYIENFHQITLNDLTNSIYKRGIYNDIDELQKNISNGDNVLEKIAERFREFDENIDVIIENKSKGKKEDIGYFVRTKLKDGIKLKKLLESMGTFKLDDFCEIKYEDITFKELKSEMRMTFLKLNTQSDQITEFKLKLNKLCGQYYKEDIKKWYNENEGVFGDLLKFVVKVDYVCNNVYVSNKYHYCKPKLVKDRDSFIEAKSLRHPIIERIIDNEYISHDISMDEKNMGILIFSVNSAGKSSLMKAIALCVIQAQCGMYTAGDIVYSVFKKLFTRISTGDNLFKNMSSFTLELSDLNTIYSNCDKYSLVIGDEISASSEQISGTSLVASSLLFLLEKKIHFLFSSHLHGLMKINEIKHAQEKLFLKIYHLEVNIDKNDNIIYNRLLKEGNGPQIYGLIVSKFIIKNSEVIEKAYKIKDELLKMEGIDTNIVSSKTSRYNNNVYVDICSYCNSKEKLEVHHIVQQKNFDKDGFNNQNLKILKDSESNLTVLCQQCHDMLHNGKIKITKKIKSSSGTIIE